MFASNLSEKNTPKSIIKINKIVVIHQLNKFMKLVKMKITNLFQWFFLGKKISFIKSRNAIFITRYFCLKILFVLFNYK
ncbi:hypothetical protein THF1D04_20559 [Vibrio owensii]|uniref:Uncharacterized protein n=1 Tax=Vibrio owensii TaxID=696485 RepID=A0AAU9Q590_9VIBR|nr:hypothetical protein THF1D04_20559 [Vibrio owensii]